MGRAKPGKRDGMERWGGRTEAGTDRAERGGAESGWVGWNRGGAMRAGIAARLREGGHTRVDTPTEKTRVQCFSVCNTGRKGRELSGDESFTVVPT